MKTLQVTETQIFYVFCPLKNNKRYSQKYDTLANLVKFSPTALTVQNYKSMLEI